MSKPDTAEPFDVVDDLRRSIADGDGGRDGQGLNERAIIEIERLRAALTVVIDGTYADLSDIMQAVERVRAGRRMPRLPGAMINPDMEQWFEPKRNAADE